MKALKMIAAAAAMSVALSGAAMAQSGGVDGVWQGAFWGGGQTPTFFQVTLTDDLGPGFSGSIVESNTFGEEGRPFLLSTLSGQIAGDSVRFTKTYDGTAGVSHSVTYEGQFVSSRRIVGTWRTEGVSGDFELAR